MLSLGKLTNLERVCIIAREGSMQIESHVVISLFEKVQQNVFLLKYLYTFSFFI